MASPPLVNSAPFDPQRPPSGYTQNPFVGPRATIKLLPDPKSPTFAEPPPSSGLGDPQRAPSGYTENPFVGPRATIKPLPDTNAPRATAPPVSSGLGDPQRAPSGYAENPFVGPRASVLPLPSSSPTTTGPVTPKYQVPVTPDIPNAVPNGGSRLSPPSAVPTSTTGGSPVATTPSIPGLGVKASAAVAKGLQAAGVVGTALTIGQAALEIANGGNVGAAVGGAGGTLSGAYAGGAYGAAIGSAILPGVGTLVGGIGGSLLGGFVGGQAGRGLGQGIGDAFNPTINGNPNPTSIPITAPQQVQADGVYKVEMTGGQVWFKNDQSDIHTKGAQGSNTYGAGIANLIRSLIAQNSGYDPRDGWRKETPGGISVSLVSPGSQAPQPFVAPAEAGGSSGLSPMGVALPTGVDGSPVPAGVGSPTPNHAPKPASAAAPNASPANLPNLQPIPLPVPIPAGFPSFAPVPSLGTSPPPSISPIPGASSIPSLGGSVSSSSGGNVTSTPQIATPSGPYDATVQNPSPALPTPTAPAPNPNCCPPSPEITNPLENIQDALKDLLDNLLGRNGGDDPTGICEADCIQAIQQKVTDIDAKLNTTAISVEVVTGCNKDGTAKTESVSFNVPEFLEASIKKQFEQLAASRKTDCKTAYQLGRAYKVLALDTWFKDNPNSEECEIEFSPDLAFKGAEFWKTAGTKPGSYPIHHAKEYMDVWMSIFFSKLGLGRFPAEVPETLSTYTDQNKPIEIYTMAEYIHWFIQQFDLLVGQFPIKIEVQDADPLKAGDQTLQVELPNISEALAELYGMALSTSTNADISINFLMRLAAEVVQIKNGVIVTQDYSKANASFLGYKGNATKHEIQYSFNPAELGSLEGFLQESTGYVQGWKEEDKETIVAYLQRLMFAAGIIKTVFMRDKKRTKTLIEDLESLIAGDKKTDDETWKKFIELINNKDSDFNRNENGFDYPVSKLDNKPIIDPPKEKK